MRSLFMLFCLLLVTGWQAGAQPSENKEAFGTPSVGPVPRVNAPPNAPGEEAGILWFGQITPTANAADARVTYHATYLYVRVAVSDQRLWYSQSPTPATLVDWDATTLYLSTSGNAGTLPGPDAYRFDAQLSSLELREGYQAAYRGNGTDWVLASQTFTTTAAWRGNGPNDDVNDRGWALTFRIPYEALGLDDPPPQGTVWGMALSLHDRDDAAGTAIVDQKWPTDMVPDEPATWGQLAFGMPDYQPPLAVPAGTATIRHGLDGAVVSDADVGGSSTCGAEAAPDYFPTWGDLNYVGKTSINIQNLGDVGDWPCFSRYYVTFPLDAVPAGQPVLSARLTLYLWGGAGQGYDPGPLPSFIQVLSVGDPWQEDTITWNNAPLARENIDAIWVYPVDENPGPPGIPYQWDVTRAVVEAQANGAPVRLALYEADWAYHSGKYFYASDTGDWNAEGRPTLTVTWGQAGGHHFFLPLVSKNSTPADR